MAPKMESPLTQTHPRLLPQLVVPREREWGASTTDSPLFFLADPGGHAQRYTQRYTQRYGPAGPQRPLVPRAGIADVGGRVFLLVRNNNGNKIHYGYYTQGSDLETGLLPSSSLHLVFTTPLGWSCCSAALRTSQVYR